MFLVEVLNFVSKQISHKLKQSFKPSHPQYNAHPQIIKHIQTQIYNLKQKLINFHYHLLTLTAFPMNLLIDISMATGPVLGYLHQYFLIKLDQSVGTFSIDICGILLFANILRLEFYLFQHYQLALFFQSIIMITAQVLLVHICAKYSLKNTQVKLEANSASAHHQYQSQTPERIWRWARFSSYFIFIAGFALSTLTASVVFKQLDFQPYGVFIGLIALLSESMLILPQILQNYRQQSTKGLSRPLVALNLSGDIFKLIYFLMKDQAFQFIMCGIIQVILDSFVVGQIFYYRKLADEKFQKENKSLVIQKKKGSTATKTQSQNRLEEIEMKNMDQLSPQADDSMVLETSYSGNRESQRINQAEYNSSQIVDEMERDPEGSGSSDEQDKELEEISTN